MPSPSEADMLAAARPLFESRRVDADEMAMTLRWAAEATGEIVDPHTAIGLAAAREASIDPAVPVVTLATAHAAKFRDAVERATGIRPAMPRRCAGLFDREERFATLPADYAAVRDFVTARATPR